MSYVRLCCVIVVKNFFLSICNRISTSFLDVTTRSATIRVGSRFMKIFPSWLCLILVFSRRLSSSTLVCSVLSWNSSYSHSSRSFLLSVRANFLSALVKFVVHYGISKDIRVECRICAIIQRSLWLTMIKLIKDLVRDCWNAFNYLWSASISSFLMSFPSHVSSSDSPEKQMRKTFIFESRYNAFDKKKRVVPSSKYFLSTSISYEGFLLI